MHPQNAGNWVFQRNLTLHSPAPLLIGTLQRFSLSLLGPSAPLSANIDLSQGQRETVISRAHHPLRPGKLACSLALRELRTRHQTRSPRIPVRQHLRDLSFDIADESSSARTVRIYCNVHTESTCSKASIPFASPKVSLFS